MASRRIGGYGPWPGGRKPGRSSQPGSDLPMEMAETLVIPGPPYAAGPGTGHGADHRMHPLQVGSTEPSVLRWRPARPLAVDGPDASRRHGYRPFRRDVHVLDVAGASVGKLIPASCGVAGVPAGLELTRPRIGIMVSPHQGRLLVLSLVRFVVPCLWPGDRFSYRVQFLLWTPTLL